MFERCISSVGIATADWTGIGPAELLRRADEALYQAKRSGRDAIWVYDLTGRPPVPLIEKGDNYSPVWFPDGTRVAFASNKSGQNSFYSLPSDGSTLDPQPLESHGIAAAIDLESISPDFIIERLHIVADERTTWGA